MSLRNRLRPAPAPTAPDPDAEGRAARLLAAQRGRAPIAAAPRAGKAATALLRTLLPRASMGFSELRRRWTEVAGAPFADKTAPEKLAGGVLTIRAPGALAPFLQQQAPLLIERLRLAGADIKSLRIEQRAAAPAKSSNLKRLRADLTPLEEAALTQRFDGVDDPKLRAALLRLGRAVKRA